MLGAEVAVPAVGTAAAQTATVAYYRRTPDRARVFGVPGLTPAVVGETQRDIGFTPASGCGNIGPLGVTGTPVIDETSGTLDVAAVVEANGGHVHRFFALSLANGATLAPMMGRINVALIQAHWADILRIVASTRTGTVTASVIMHQFAAHSRRTVSPRHCVSWPDGAHHVHA